MPAATIPVLLADTHRLFAEALADRLDREDDIEIVGVATTAEDVRRCADRSCPRVVLLDTHLEEERTLGLGAELRNGNGGPQIVFLTECLSDILISQVIDLFAGYLLKTDNLSTVLESVRTAAAGQCPFSEPIARRVRFDPARGRYELKDRSRTSSLTTRELQVLQSITRGGTTQQLADDLRLTLKGAESARYRLMQKLNIHDRVELTRWAIRTGLIRP